MSLKKNIRLLSWFNFFTDFRFYTPVAVIYFAAVTHSYALATAIFSITMVSSAIFDIPTGVYSDLIGRKRTLILGALCAVLSVVFYAIGINFYFLAIGALLEGLQRAFYSGNNNALLHNLLSEEGLEHEYHIYLGNLTSMFQAALGISAVIGGLLASSSFHWVLWLSVIPQFICLIISFQLKEPKRELEKNRDSFALLKNAVKEFIKNSDLRLLSLSSIITFGVGEAAYYFKPAFFRTLWPLWALGIAQAVANLTAFVGFRLSGKIIKKLGEIKTLLINDTIGTFVNLIALVFPTTLSPILMSATSTWYGPSNTAEGSLLQKEFTDKQRATMSSLNSFAGSLLFGVSAFTIGLIADKTGPQLPLVIAQLIFVSILLIHLKLFRRWS